MAGVMIVLCCRPAQASPFSYTTVDVAGASSTQVAAVNSSGQVAGTYVTRSTGVANAFVDTGGVITTFSVATGRNSTSAVGINDSGTVVGAYNTSSGVSNIYTRSATGTVTKLALPSSLKSTGTVPVAINDSGTITGYYTVKGGQYYGFTGSGTTFTKIANGSDYYTEPAAINAAGEIVGASLPQSGASESAFIDVGGVVSDLPMPGGTTYLAATGVNDLGEVIGNADLTSGFTAVNGVVSLFGIAGSSSIAPIAINDSGEVVGSTVVGGQTLGFLYNGTTATTFSVPGATGTDPLAINAAGEVVGYYTDSDGNDHGFLAMPLAMAVPEPASAALLMAGVVGVVFMRRRGGSRSTLPRHRTRGHSLDLE